jgi:hypothetical protein
LARKRDEEMIGYILLSTIIVILLIILVLFIRAGLNTGKQLRAYEEFYNNTLDDIESVINMLDTLMNRRQMLSDDPDVQNIYRVVVILYDILIGYKNATKKEKERKEK